MDEDSFEGIGALQPFRPQTQKPAPQVSGGVSFAPSQPKTDTFSDIGELRPFTRGQTAAPTPPEQRVVAPVQAPRLAQLPAMDVGRRTVAEKKAVDIARAAGTQGLLGLTADVPGAIGDISRLYESAAEAPYRLGLKGLSAAGLLQRKIGTDKTGKDVFAPATPEEFISSAQKVAPVSEAEQKGLVSSVYGLPFPTGAGLEKIETGLVPSLAYKGVSPEAQAAGRATRFGTSMLPGGGGLAGAAGRFGTGVAGSAIGQTAGIGLEEMRKAGYTPGALEPYTPFVEPALTMLATSGIFGAARAAGAGAQRKAAEELSGLMRRDLDAGRISAEEFSLAQQGRLPMADVFGPGSLTRSYLEQRAGIAGEDAARAVEQYSLEKGLGAHGIPIREPSSQRETQAYLSQVHGAPINAPALTASMKKTGEQIRQNVYNVARQDPKAMSIDASAFGLEPGRATALVDNPLMKDAIKEATKRAKSAPASWGIEAPVIDKKTGQTLKAGNLPFWDQVKRELDKKISDAMPSAMGAGDKNLVASLDPLRKQLIGQLDNIVPSYGRAREAALDTFMRESAPEAGMDFYKRMDAFDKHDAINAFAQMTPQGQQLFKSGFMHALHNEVGTPNGISKIVNKIFRDPDFDEKARMALGGDYDAVRGKLLVEDIANKAKALAPKHVPPGILQKYGPTPVGAVLALAADYAIQSQFLAPSHVGAIVAGGTISGTRQLAQHAYQRRIADQAVELMLSKKPEDHATLSRMMSSDPAFANTVGEINKFIQSASQPRKEREGRATGGSVRRGMNAQMLIAAVERAKANGQKTTEPLLDAPDEHIVQALKVANEHI